MDEKGDVTGIKFYKDIKDLKKTILLRKIYLSYIIDSYAYYDRGFRWSVMVLAGLTPLVAAMGRVFSHAQETTERATIVLGSMVAGMIKLKEYLKFDKIRDHSKAQTIKYSHLLMRIEQEMLKSLSLEENLDFLYWANREYSFILMDDPEISYSQRREFLEICKKREIKFNDDFDELKELQNLNEVSSQNIDTQTSLKPANRIMSFPMELPNVKEDMTKYNNKKEYEWTLQRLKMV
jgi:hypothetical protein